MLPLMNIFDRARRRVGIRATADAGLSQLGGSPYDHTVTAKMMLWSVVVALVVYGIALYARGDFA